MLKKLMIVAAFAVSGLVATTTANNAQENAYPGGPVTLVVATNPGGPTDVFGRLIAERLEKMWGQPVIVDNRPGGAQMIGANSVAKAEPDGLTLLVSNDGPITINPNLYSKMEYDPQEELKPVTLAVELPLILVVNPDIEAKTTAELIEVAKAKPLDLNFAYGGSTSMMAAKRFAVATGIELTGVPYKGSGPSVQALIAGEVDMMFDGMASSLPQVQAGKLRALGVTSGERIKGLDDIPTVGETIDGYQGSTWLGLFAPAGTDDAVVQKIRDSVAEVLSDAELADRLIKLGMYPVANAPADFSAMLVADKEEWAKVVREGNIPKAN